MATEAVSSLAAHFDPMIETVQLAPPTRLEILSEARTSAFVFDRDHSEEEQIVPLLGLWSESNEAREHFLRLECEILSAAGRHFTLRAKRRVLSELAKAPGSSVQYLQLAQPLEYELNSSISATRGKVRMGMSGQVFTGQDTFIGIIDSGLDFYHPDFRNANGTTRVEAIWDQTLKPKAGEAPPAPFTYGVEYQQDQINHALQVGWPNSIVSHQDNDPFGHGTHVAGIAAGNGSQNEHIKGMAPGADLIIVKNQPFTTNTATLMEAITYIVKKAKELERPVVINLSQGNNDGPHDGTSPVEGHIDTLIVGPGIAMVKSAGNEGRSRHHTHVFVPRQGRKALLARCFGGQYDRIEIWYNNPDRLSLQLIDPRRDSSPVIPPDDAATGTIQVHQISFTSGNLVRITNQIHHPFNQDGCIILEFFSDGASEIVTGVWTVLLLGDTVRDGEVHGWAMRNSQFEFVDATDQYLITFPGTATRMITVGNYDDVSGRRADSSSSGPGRQLRLRKPEISAPGTNIISAATQVVTGNGFGGGYHHQLSGTSMAAPHGTGTAALHILLVGKPFDTLGVLAIRQRLIDTGFPQNSADGFTGDKDLFPEPLLKANF